MWVCLECLRGPLLKASPLHRAQLSPEAVLKQGLSLQTLGYRAPEVLFGCQDYGCAIDGFSLGTMLAELAGDPFNAQLKTSRWNSVDYMICLFQQLGTPEADVFGDAPLRPADPPRYNICCDRALGFTFALVVAIFRSMLV